MSEPQVQVVTSRYMRKKNTQLKHENRRLESELAALRAAIERGMIGETDGTVDTRKFIIPIAEYNALCGVVDAAEAFTSTWGRSNGGMLYREPEIPGTALALKEALEAMNRGNTPG